MIKIGNIKGSKVNAKGQPVTLYYSYMDVKFDEDGWADTKEFIPADFDLCYLKIKDKKTKSGWANGLKWDGLNVDPDDEVLYWKINKN